MTKFLKLTGMIININYIHSIVIKPNKYHINVISNKFNGLNWTIHGCGIGNIYSYNSEIEICESQNRSDYKIVSDWINKH